MADLQLPLTVVAQILGYCDVRTVARAHCGCRVLRNHLLGLGARESDSLWGFGHFTDHQNLLLQAQCRFALPNEPAVRRLAVKRRWERAGPPNSSDPSCSKSKSNTTIISSTCPIIALNAAIVANSHLRRANNLENPDAQPKSKANNILAVVDAFAYVGPQKSLALANTTVSATTVPIAAAAVASIYTPPFPFTSTIIVPLPQPLLFVQSAQPRLLLVVSLADYARVTVRTTPPLQKKPFIFRLLNWTHAPWVYFVDRDSYQRRLFFYDAVAQILVPVVATTATPTIAPDSAANRTIEPLDPFHLFVDPEDATVNDNFAAFGDTVIWWTWVNDVGGNEVEINQAAENVIHNPDTPTFEIVNGRRVRRQTRYELKVHAYKITKIADIYENTASSGNINSTNRTSIDLNINVIAGVQVDIKPLWVHHIHLTASQNLSAHLTNNRLHIFHHKKFKPKNHAEIVALYSFDLVHGLVEAETILEKNFNHNVYEDFDINGATVNNNANEINAENLVVAIGGNNIIEDVNNSKLPYLYNSQTIRINNQNAATTKSYENPVLRKLIGSRASNERIYTRFHALEFHRKRDFFTTNGSIIDENADTQVNSGKPATDSEDDMYITGYDLPGCTDKLFTVRDHSLTTAPEPPRPQLSLVLHPVKATSSKTTINVSNGRNNKSRNNKEQPSKNDVNKENTENNPLFILPISLAPKNVWRPSTRQVSQDGSLLLVAGIEGSRRCLRVVDVAHGDAERGIVRAFYLDDVANGGGRKKVGGGVFVISRRDEAYDSDTSVGGVGWQVVFVECGGGVKN
ncbi:hypothetical protein HK100_007927 [Physocladia obscura]|uniref:F-box domain-containing protein n=1 Tax=Physocladia obscura TaxID=109957 RepID=A0AAD5TA92_9FUNG|nr:hypothetical protein HK100_007927 [Physocladia obscura]